MGLDNGIILECPYEHFETIPYFDKHSLNVGVELNIEAGDFNGVLIGKNSKHLIALQALVSSIINNYYAKVLVDALDLEDEKKIQETNEIIRSMEVELNELDAEIKKLTTAFAQVEFLDDYEIDDSYTQKKSFCF